MERKRPEIRAGRRGQGRTGAREDASTLWDFGKRQPVMATVREKGKQTWRETCLQLQRRREGGGGREGFPDSALSPLRSSGAPGLGSASKPPLPALLGGGTACLWGRLLLLRSGDRVPNTPAASLRDARLTDSCPSQSPPGLRRKVDFPNEPIGRRGGRALVIGVLLGVESSKQPWSTASGRAQDASSLALNPSWGSTRDKRNPQRGDRRQGASQKSKSEWASFRAPGREVLTCSFTSFLFCAKPLRFCCQDYYSPSSLGLKTLRRA